MYIFKIYYIFYFGKHKIIFKETGRKFPKPFGCCASCAIENDIRAAALIILIVLFYDFVLPKIATFVMVGMHGDRKSTTYVNKISEKVYVIFELRLLPS